jgi:hypothetical protein
VNLQAAGGRNRQWGNELASTLRGSKAVASLLLFEAETTYSQVIEPV